MKLKPRDVSIKDLRKLGGEWTAERLGFGYYAYHGKYCGSVWKLQSYSHVGFDVGGREYYYSRWHLTRDGMTTTSSDPVMEIKMLAKPGR